jgi:DNA-directed RNA polymerase III subunit RPC6
MLLRNDLRMVSLDPVNPCRRNKYVGIHHHVVHIYRQSQTIDHMNPIPPVTASAMVPPPQQQPQQSSRKRKATTPTSTKTATNIQGSRRTTTTRTTTTTTNNRPMVSLKAGASGLADSLILPIPVVSSTDVTTTTTMATTNMKERLLHLFTLPKYQRGISNSQLKDVFQGDYQGLAPILNDLSRQSRLKMSKINTTIHPHGTTSTNTITTTGSTTELLYELISPEMAMKLHGLDVSTQLVYQVIERAGNVGIWTKDIRLQTNVQQQAMNKIFKVLEGRQLIKPVKSVLAKSKKLYMSYHLVPSQELTGGIWYSDLEFDHEFINELRQFILHCIQRRNHGRGISVSEIRHTIQVGQISRVELSQADVLQLVRTLMYDYMVEEITVPTPPPSHRSSQQHGDDIDETSEAHTVYIATTTPTITTTTNKTTMSSMSTSPPRQVTTVCEFNWWEVLEDDFPYRSIRFEDDIIIPAQEYHYQS